ncbi:hypothetical protein GE09DRAFT_1065080 [Coniochaeta sp. 2T2.1]|nr:hypothetical protein GE09DRAFT_1065080 [Coniochaeta sp. 2T2.1]
MIFNTITVLPFVTAVLGESHLCVPDNKSDQANAYTWSDQTAKCAETGHCAEACVVFVTSWSPGHIDQPAIDDLKSVMTQQIKKDGFTESTTVGHWYSTFGGFTTALPNQAIEEEFLAGIDAYLAGEDVQIPSSVYFRNSDSEGQEYITEAIWNA